ncbi:MAG: hypothetical protein Q8Q06_03165 [bacterium]|nr:hypothetical protein [bacterium]
MRGDKLVWLRGIIMPVILIFLAFLVAHNAHCQSILLTQAGQEAHEVGIEEPEFQLTPDYLLEAIYQGRPVLEGMELNHSDETGKYKVKRRLPSGAIAEQEDTDPQWKEMALQLMNLNTGEVRFIKALKVLDELVYTGKDFVLELEGRPAGPEWNAYRTRINVVSPSGWAVIANKYKRYRKSGEIDEIIYSAPSSALNRPEFVQEGLSYFREAVDEAVDEILNSKPNNVELPTFAMGREWVAEVAERIGLIEQTDPYEVLEFDRHKIKPGPFEDVYLEMFLNQDFAFGPTVSTANAAGLMQFMEATWNAMMFESPWANLPDFKTGVASHVQSIKAQILLHNHNAKWLNDRFKTNVLDWREPEYYPTACHNGSCVAVAKAMKWANATGAGPGKWRERLPRYQRNRTTETLYFLKKLDVAIKNGYGRRQ